MAVTGQALTILLAELATEAVPLVPVMAAVAASVLFNLSSAARNPLDERRATLHLAFDLVQLAVLVGLTGGLTNPFALFLMAPVAIGAATLSSRQTALLAGLAVAAGSTMMAFHLPLPWPGGGLVLPRLYMFGAWCAQSAGVASIAFFTWQMAQESRHLAAAFAETQLRLAQEQRRTEIGALAAAVAHELNTPLATITLLARDAQAEILPGTPLAADLATLVSESERCRDIITSLIHRRARDEAVHAERLPFPSLVENAAQAQADAGITLVFDHHPWPGGESTPPWVRHSPEIVQGLGNLIQNAVQFARSQVEISTAWDHNGHEVRIMDDGPGIPAHVLERLGEPYLSTRDEDGDHLGLGLFIAVTLLERTRARLSFSEPPEGGTEVVVSWRSMDDDQP